MLLMTKNGLKRTDKSDCILLKIIQGAGMFLIGKSLYL